MAMLKNLALVPFILGYLSLSACKSEPAPSDVATSSGNFYSTREVQNVLCVNPQVVNGAPINRTALFTAPTLDWLTQAGWVLQDKAFEPTSRAFLSERSASYLDELTPLSVAHWKVDAAVNGERYKISLEVSSSHANRPSSLTWSVYSPARLPQLSNPIQMQFPLPSAIAESGQWQKLEGSFDSLGSDQTYIRMQGSSEFAYRNIKLERLGESPATGNPYSAYRWYERDRANSHELLQELINDDWIISRPGFDPYPVEPQFTEHSVNLTWQALDNVTAACPDQPSMAKRAMLEPAIGYKGRYQLRITTESALPPGLVLHLVGYFEFLSIPPSTNTNSFTANMAKVIKPTNAQYHQPNQVIFDIDPKNFSYLTLWVKSPFTPIKITSITLNQTP